MTRSAEIAAARDADTKIAALYGEYHLADAHHRQLVTKLETAEDLLQKHLARDLQIAAARDEKTIARLQQAIAESQPIVAAALKAAQDLNNELYKGWTRFFLVQHIHNTMYCSSFRPTTRVGWLPDVSGLTEAEAVAQHGATLCTICFPSAPVELTRKPVDDTVCTGSGARYDESKYTGREHAYYSPSGYCTVCGEQIGLTARGSGKIRKHKKPAA